MTACNYTHGRDDLVFACPACDRAGQLRERADGTVRCYECGREMAKGDVVQRGDRTGENLDADRRSRGGRGATPGPERMAEIGAKGGHPTAVDRASGESD